MTVLSLKYTNAYYLKNGQTKKITSNEFLSQLLGVDMVNGNVRFLSLSDKVYICHNDEDIYFSENIKSFMDNSLSNKKALFDDNVLAAYLSAGFVVPPFTLFQNIYVIPSYTLININNSFLSIENYYPDDCDSLEYPGFTDINDFESFLRSIVADQLGSMDEKDNIICTLSGGADSSLLLKIISDLVPLNKITSITCIMTGLESEAQKAKAISKYLKISHLQYKYDANDSVKFLTEFISNYNVPIYDPIFPVYNAMIKSLNRDINFKERKNIIIEGQCADSVLLGLPHNLLMQLYKPQLSVLLGILNSIIPIIDNKNKYYKRLIYRVKKTVSSLSQSTWLDCLLNSFDLNVLFGSPYIEHLREQLSEFYQYYGNVHKAIAHFFMFRIIQVREMQKYVALPHNYKVIAPFGDIRFIGRAFATQESFFIEKWKKKKPIFDLVERYFPDFYTRQKTTPFYVEYKLSNQKVELNEAVFRNHHETISRNLRAYDVDRDLKIQSLNLLYLFSSQNQKV